MPECMKGPSYVHWVAKMAIDLQIGVPWVMFKHTDAPDAVVSFASQLRLLLVLIRNSPANFKLFSLLYCKIQLIA